MLYIISYYPYYGEDGTVWYLISDLDASIIESIVKMQKHSLDFVCKDYEQVSGQTCSLPQYLTIEDFVDMSPSSFVDTPHAPPIIREDNFGILMSLPAETVKEMLGYWKKLYRNKGWERSRNAVSFLKKEYFK